MTKFDKQIRSLSDRQISLARAFQREGITSYSQAIKALANHDDEVIAKWKAQLSDKTQPAAPTTIIVESHRCGWMSYQRS